MRPLQKKRGGEAPEGDQRLEPPFIPDDAEPDSFWDQEPSIGEVRGSSICVGRDPLAAAHPEDDWSFMAGGWIWVDQADADRVYRDDLGEYWLRGAE